MLNVRKIWDDLYWLAGNDLRIARFENYIPLDRGVSYNSYLLVDEDKSILFDTVDRSVADNWLEKVEKILGERSLDYLIIQHMEPDHCAGINEVLARYPECQVIGNKRTMQFLKQIRGRDYSDRAQLIKDGDELKTAHHHFKFVFAPMVHWPEVFVTYDLKQEALFSADAFGSFKAVVGNIYADEVDWKHEFLDEARRYYLNIVGKQGAAVMRLFAKLDGLPLSYIFPLHGVMFRGESIPMILGYYTKWASYEPEEKGVVFAISTMYGNMQQAAEALALKLGERGVKKIIFHDVSQSGCSHVLADCYRYSHVVFCSVTYNADLYFNMHSLLHELQVMNFQKRRYALMVSQTWAGMAEQVSQEMIQACPELTQVGETIKILTQLTDEQEEAIDRLADQIAAEILA